MKGLVRLHRRIVSVEMSSYGLQAAVQSIESAVGATLCSHAKSGCLRASELRMRCGTSLSGLAMLSGRKWRSTDLTAPNHDLALLRNKRQLERFEELAYAIEAGMPKSISVPALGRLQISKVAPFCCARSRIPLRP